MTTSANLARRRGFLVILVGLLAATSSACSESSDAEKSASVTSTNATVTSPDVSTSAAGAGDPLIECGDFPRTVTHDLGETIVDSAPKRVAALYGGNDLDNLIALGVTPVVAGDYGKVSDSQPFAEYLGDATAEIEAMASREPNLERLAALAPDLVFSTASRLEDNYALVSEIAPTIAIPRDNDPVENLLSVACATGTEDMAAAVVSAYQADITETAAALKGHVDGTVAFVETDGASYFCVFNTNNNAIALFGSLGVTVSEGAVSLGAEETERDCAELSAERIAEIDADRLFIFAGPVTANAEEAVAALSSNPLWQSLKAVENGDVHVVGTAWLVRASVLANRSVLQELRTLYLD